MKNPNHRSKTPSSNVTRNHDAAFNAAHVSIGIAALVLGVVVVLSEASSKTATFVHSVGKLWIPGAEGIGPYSGKETFALLAWLISWALLSRVFGKFRISDTGAFLSTLVLVGIGTTLVWPPVWGLFLQH